MKNFRFSMAVLTLCLFAASAFAQSNTGTLVGTVIDQQGSSVAGASVTVTDNATGKERTLQTSNDGVFNLQQLEVGTYTIKITAQGFKTYTATELKIDIGKTYSLNASLEPGVVTENVTVVAGADVVNSTSAELTTTVSQRQIQELPLNGRNPLALIGLQAGTASNGATNTVINGQQSSFTNITRDGLNIQDNFIRSNATDFVPDRANTDDVGEFTISTQNAGAERGYGSSQIELLTPRGSSEFHGAAFIYNRNSKFSANSFFNNRAGVKKSFLNRNQFGGRFSGPLPLPRFGEGGASTWKDKGFFFGTYEGFRLRQSTSAVRTILLPSARSGIITYNATCGVTGQPACPAGITNGQQRTLNVLTASGLPADALVASRILANVPTAGNDPTLGDGRNTTGFRFNQLQNQDRETVTTRFDVEANSKHSVSLIYGWRKELLLRPDVDFTKGYNVTPFGFQDAHTNEITAAWRYSPTTSLTNEVRGGFFKSDPAFDRTNQATDFFFTTPLISNPEAIFQAQGRNTRYFNIQDNAVWVKGDHSFKFGGQSQFFRIQPFGPPAESQSSIPTLRLATGASTPSLASSAFPGGISTTDLGTANNLLALLAGIVDRAELTFNATSTTSGFVPGATRVRNLEFENHSLYFSDGWRVSPALSLNLGLRYELFTPIKERDRLGLEPVMPNLDDPLSAILNPTGTYDFIGTNAGGNKFFKTDRNNFAPVLSFAWSPSFKNNLLGSLFPGEGRTVIRGGYRLSYVNDEFVRGADNAISGNVGLTTTVVQTSLNRRLNQGAPAFTSPTFLVPRTYAQNNVLAGNFGTVFAIDPNLQVPATHEWNIGIQREVGFQSVIELRYVGSMSNNLIRGLDYNQIEIRNNGFLDDFERARRNMLRFGNNPACNAADVIARGCELLTVFPSLEAGGLLSNSTIRSLISGGTPAALAETYIVNIFGGSSQLFLPNPNTGVADLLSNSSKLRYHSLQAEWRRRFSKGLQFQANYTWQRAYTDTGGVGQTNFDPALDIRNVGIEYQLADYNAEHVFNFNGIYELPFGKGKRWLNDGGIADTILGGWQVTSIVQIATGAPITITDPRGTLNRAGRSGRQTPTVNVSNQEIQKLIGIFNTKCGIFWINPSVLNINQDALAAGNCSALTGTGFSGRAANGFGSATFPGQIFFNNNPGNAGNLGRNIANGPLYANWDASIIKNIPLDRIKEGMRFQIRGEAFNVLNRPNFFIGNLSGQSASTSFNVNSTLFGRVGGTFGSRIIQFVGRLEF